MIVKKLFEKHETLMCLILVFLYVVANSFCLQNFGLDDYRSLIINVIFSFGLIVLTKILNKTEYYGLTKITDHKKYLFFIPMLLIASTNLWGGICFNGSISKTIIYILTMINVGFIEEMVFRAFLFRMMEKGNIKRAIIVSSITFGIGHIVNLLNGAELIPTLVQICYAISIGYLFVTIFYKSKSLVPCIITHALINSLSVFNGENMLTIYIAPIFLVIMPIIYSIYINKTVK